MLLPTCTLLTGLLAAPAPAPLATPATVALQDTAPARVAHLQVGKPGWGRLVEVPAPSVKKLPLEARRPRRRLPHGKPGWGR